MVFFEEKNSIDEMIDLLLGAAAAGAGAAAAEEGAEEEEGAAEEEEGAEVDALLAFDLSRLSRFALPSLFLVLLLFSDQSRSFLSPPCCCGFFSCFGFSCFSFSVSTFHKEGRRPQAASELK